MNRQIIFKLLWLATMIWGLLLTTLYFTLCIDNSLRIFIKKECHKLTSFALIQSFKQEVSAGIEKYLYADFESLIQFKRRFAK